MVKLSLEGKLSQSLGTMVKKERQPVETMGAVIAERARERARVAGAVSGATANREGAISDPELPFGLKLADAVVNSKRRAEVGRDLPFFLGLSFRVLDPEGNQISRSAGLKFGPNRFSDALLAKNEKELNRYLKGSESRGRSLSPHLQASQRGQLRPGIERFLKALGWDGRVWPVSPAETFPLDDTPTGRRARLNTELDAQDPTRLSAPGSDKKKSRLLPVLSGLAGVGVVAFPATAMAVEPNQDQVPETITAKEFSQLLVAPGVNFEITDFRVETEAKSAKSQPVSRAQALTEQVAQVQPPEGGQV